MNNNWVRRGLIVGLILSVILVVVGCGDSDDYDDLDYSEDLDEYVEYSDNDPDSEGVHSGNLSDILVEISLGSFKEDAENIFNKYRDVYGDKTYSRFFDMSNPVAANLFHYDVIDIKAELIDIVGKNNRNRTEFYVMMNVSMIFENYDSSFESDSNIFNTIMIYKFTVEDGKVVDFNKY